MIIDKDQGFDTDTDNLIWKKIISINPYQIGNDSTHVVKYYKSSHKEYYIFEYISADNNGKSLRDYSNSYYMKLSELLNPKDDACFYEKAVNTEEYLLITVGYLINISKSNKF